MAERLQHRVSIVTGAAQGIGAAIARCFVEEGARVMLADLNRTAGEELARELRELGGRVAFEEVDITDGAAVERMVARAAAELGSVDVLINNAGRDVCAPPLEMTREQWRQCFALNLEGAWNCCRAVLPTMIAARRGSIVNMASVQGINTLPGTFPYPVAKHAVIGLTRALAIEYGKHGIRVNTVSPGYINTRSREHYRSLPNDYYAYRERVIEMHPQRHLGEPEDVAWAVVFLASDEARFVNAANLVIDGGQSELLHP